ncbi:type VI secretion system ATPase TssH [Xanthomonas vasicola]|uniref:type VI secretion system ATPase TssH n=1 Tax=Xanthomonas vasicola TaxID=56459 RepID=UPI000DE26E01|nr:type VI secretion system ATPase TssH [Xanthomonas vasicola]RJL83467.1 type VI secretion system ATPase TssH [Xanthomonas vasicola]RJL93973.1 type VI secretion system ATPase TssH [Xanthomonas vasicola]RJN00418.1 type VI secretion system ATPase TssH [Xanthomonas vasicola]RJN03479.1 type VI secretion system ATPase TssH [Xanthomonas vasicola]
MADISRAALFGKLNKTTYRGIESATAFCRLRGDREVELLHWLHQLLQAQDGDLHRIVRRFSLDASRLAQDLTAALDRLPRGGGGHFDLSASVEEAVERAWVHCTLRYGRQRIRGGDLLVAILHTRSLRNGLLAMSSEFGKLRAETLADDLDDIVAGSPEEDASDLATAVAPVGTGATGGAAALALYTVDLTAQAREGKLDPIIGRDDEIRQVVDILMRRRQNNPILVGEAGVGKTAVVEGFAQRIARGDVPPALKKVQLRTLDVGLLQAGASMKGEFEQRLRAVIDEVQASPKPIILFVDETHTLVGAGGAAGTGDAANLLKPALARGTLRTVGATTFAEYKKYIEKDPALTRRFQAVQVDEPDEAKAVRMMRGVASTMEQHHRVQILDEALEGAVKLSHRYIPARQLPDKSVSLLDTACARVAVSLHATPAEVENSRRRIESLETEHAIIERERAIGVVVEERAAVCASLLESEHGRLRELEQRWAAEKVLVDELLSLRARLRGGNAPVEGTGSALEVNAGHLAIGNTAVIEAPVHVDRDTLLARLQLVQAELAALQGQSPLILPTVDYQAVAGVVADWTGIPVGRMARNEIDTVLRLPELLAKRVIGQDHAMEMIAKRIQTSRAGLDNPDKPIGVFLLAGTSGVGKTETALALAETLYGGEQNLITINMSEYQEAHTVSSLKGAPPGYVGYGEGGVLTEAVRRKPYSVVLLDEVEKAHPDVHELFFQVFDKGWMEDGEGRRIDFRNTLIILTSNAGTDLIASLCKDPELMPDPEGMAKAIREPLLKVFPPALLGRLVAIPYYPLSNAMLGQIVRLQLNRIRKRIEERYRIPFEYDDSVVELVVSRCTESESGGRMIDAILTNSMLPEISRELLVRTIAGEECFRVKVCVAESGLIHDFG